MWFFKRLIFGPVRQILDKQSETGIQKHDLYDMKPLKSFVNQRIHVLVQDNY
jgi:hypothetical protein